MKRSNYMSQQELARVARPTLPRSVFNRSHSHRTTFDAGFLYPVYVEEVYPGDTWNVNCQLFAWLTTPHRPVFDEMRVDLHWFFVPNRLTWDHWEDFITGAGDVTYETPVVDADGGHASLDLFDYLDVPWTADYDIIAFPARAYRLIWNTWYRRQQIQDEITVETGDGPDDKAGYPLLRRNKYADYFTTCLPQPQAGNAPTLGLGGTAPVVSDGNAMRFNSTLTGAFQMTTTGASALISQNWGSASGSAVIVFDDQGLEVDLTQVAGFSLNAWRETVALQHLLELDQRGGQRYVESLRMHFSVAPEDYRLQRPELLGGCSTTVDFTPVPKTSQDGTDPLGHIGALAKTQGSHRGFNYSANEHGWIIGLISTRSDLTYFQGVRREYSRRDRDEYYFPSFAHLGEQPVYRKEIYAVGADSHNSEYVWGYNERFSELRFAQNKLTGLFRKSLANGFETWSLAQTLAYIPELNSAFLEEDPPMDDVVLAPDEPHFYLDLHFEAKAARVMPTYSVPGLEKL